MEAAPNALDPRFLCSGTKHVTAPRYSVRRRVHRGGGWRLGGNRIHERTGAKHVTSVEQRAVRRCVTRGKRGVAACCHAHAGGDRE